jgi:hypothetical protein
LSATSSQTPKKRRKTAHGKTGKIADRRLTVSYLRIRHRHPGIRRPWRQGPRLGRTRPGQGGPGQGLLRKAGSEQHYQFAELDAFVVSLPAAALQGIARNPNVTRIEEDPLRYLDAGTRRPARLAPAGDKPPSQRRIVPYGIDLF